MLLVHLAQTHITLLKIQWHLLLSQHYICLVSLNGVIQSPLSSFSVSGSTITFLPSSGTLSSSDTIDFILVLGNVLDIGTPSDSTVTNAKTNFVSTSSSAGLQIKGDGTTDGTLQLNCSQNSHGIKLASPAHSAGQSYTLTFPTTAPSANKFLKTDGSGNLSFASAGIEEYDTWRITANSSDTSDTYLSGNWERTDTTSFEKIGTGMSESSGVFSFPSTGKYLLHAFFTMQVRSGTVDQGTCRIFQTTNNSSYDSITVAEFSGSSGEVSTVSCSFLLDVTDTSNQKIRVKITTDSNTIRALGSTSINRTYITFMKIGDT